MPRRADVVRPGAQFSDRYRRHADLVRKSVVVERPSRLASDEDGRVGQPPTQRTAGTLEPSALRSLDALHLATALELGADLEGMVTYDARMARAAEASLVTVAAPAEVAGG